MATYKYEDLAQKYDNFAVPSVSITVNGKDITKAKGKGISDIDIELTSGYEASIASFVLYDMYDREKSKFLTEDAEKFIALGSCVDIGLGYGGNNFHVFCGIITRVNFFVEDEKAPGIRVTCMDVKSIMMANNHSKQLTAKTYSAAVKEIFESGVYAALKDNNVVSKYIVSDTPDAQAAGGGTGGGAGGGGGQEKASDRTIEFVAESDYEFVVRAAKRYNFDFFALYNVVYFRPAKSNADVLFTLTPKSKAFHSFNLEYDITGLVETVEARGMNTGEAKAITEKVSFNNSISLGSKAKKYISKTEKVYVDPSITSAAEAKARAESLMENISYRFGTMEAELNGIPQMAPGNYVEVKEFGKATENKYYITNVHHTLDNDGGFVTKIIGKVNKIGE